MRLIFLKLRRAQAFEVQRKMHVNAFLQHTPNVELMQLEYEVAVVVALHLKHILLDPAQRQVSRVTLQVADDVLELVELILIREVVLRGHVFEQAGRLLTMTFTATLVGVRLESSQRPLVAFAL